MMEQRLEDGLSPYHVFSRAEWAARREDTPMTLTADEVTRLRSLRHRGVLAARRPLGPREHVIGRQPVFDS